jgi:hypothetical protein
MSFAQLKKLARIHATSALLLLAFTCSTVQAAEAPLSATDIAERIQNHGAPATIRLLQSGNARGWKSVTSNISSGYTDWVQLAPALARGVDAASGEDLDYALSLALLKVPNLVIALLGTTFPTERICSVPFIEPTKAQARAFLRNAIKKVEAVRDEGLKSAREACLASLLSRSKD